VRETVSVHMWFSLDGFRVSFITTCVRETVSVHMCVRSHANTNLGFSLHGFRV
jgi:hypothetical protein